jgi:zinc protease
MTGAANHPRLPARRRRASASRRPRRLGLALALGAAAAGLAAGTGLVADAGLVAGASRTDPTASASRPPLAPPASAAAHRQANRIEQLRFPPPPRFDIPRPRRIVLDNGMVVMLVEDHELPLVTATVLLRAGSRLDPPAKLGLGEIAGEVMRTGGIARREASAIDVSGDALDELLEARAATLEVSIGRDSGSATLSVLKEDFAGLLPLLAALLRHPAFDAGKLDLAKQLARAQLARQDDDPDELAARQFASLVYGPRSVYGRTPTLATIGAITRGDLVSWHRRHVHPESVVLGLAGDFQTEQALAAIRAAFADWPRGPGSPVAAGPATDAFTYRREPNPGLFVIDKSDMNQVEVIVGHLGVVKSDPDYFALQVLNEVLSGSLAARLPAHVRTEKGLAYSVEGGIAGDWDHPGLAVLSLATQSRNAAAGVEALLGEARDLLAHPPTDEEVARARQSILASFVFHSDSPAKVLAQQLICELFGYPLDWLDRYRAGVEAVTTGAVRQAAVRHLHPEQLTLLVVGPAASADRSLAAFGKPVVLPLPRETHSGR